MHGSISNYSSGRPFRSGKFGGKPTKTIRVPIDRVEEIFEFLETEAYEIPLYLSKVPAGFPSPAEDFIEDKINIAKLLIENPAATFFIRVSGDSMIDEKIFPGDILTIDRSLEAVHGSIVLASVNSGEFTVKKLYRKDGVIKLLPANKAYAPIEIEDNLEIWGVVRGSVRLFGKN